MISIADSNLFSPTFVDGPCWKTWGLLLTSTKPPFLAPTLRRARRSVATNPCDPWGCSVRRCCTNLGGHFLVQNDGIGGFLLPSGYVKIAMEHHHFSWENPLLMVIFNSYVKLPEGKWCLWKGKKDSLQATDVHIRQALSCISHEPHLNRAFQFMLSVGRCNGWPLVSIIHVLHCPSEARFW